jgi:sigma-B regulation protein RsbU (phosphoserine phosphatase)
MVAAFVLVTVFAIGLAALLMFRGLTEVPLLGRLEAVRDIQGLHQVLEEVVSAKLLNLVRTGVLLLDPAAHAEAQQTLDQASAAYRRVREALLAIRQAGELTTPIYTLTDYDPATQRARVVVVSDDDAFLQPGAFLTIGPEAARVLGWTFEDGFARSTPIYWKWNDARGQREQWITAFAPIVDTTGAPIAVITVEHQGALFSYWFDALSLAVMLACVVGGLVATAVGIWLAWRVTRPISALTGGVARVTGGDLSLQLPVRSRDEVGRLTGAFNDMVEGLRQRDFIRNTFGRYVSPEVAKTLLESPEGLKFGGEKREITVLMSDLRGYTRFAEQGDPAWVMEILNDYLARMTDLIIEYGGTINEFIGDAIFAVYGAPIPYRDHAERAAASALAMQRAMDEINQAHIARGRPRFEMGIGIHTGEAVVGNIGSELRAKYAVVGAAVNLAARIEGCTMGGQIFLSPATYECIRALADVAPPVSIEVKGIAAPLLLYELRGIGGRFAQRLPERDTAAERQVDVSLPVTCWMIDGKVVGAEVIAGTVQRLGLQQLAIRFDTPLRPLTNVRLRLTYPVLGHDSDDVYGKVLATEQHNGACVACIGLTSVDPADQKILAGFLGS